MDGGRFLVACIRVEETSRSLQWLTNDADSRYTAFDPIDLPDNTLRRVFRLYQNTYRDLSAQPLISKDVGLLKYNRWILFCKEHVDPESLPEDSDIVGFALAGVKAPGLKIGLMGHDGSKEGKHGVIRFAIGSFNAKDVFGEVSPPIETIVVQSVPAVEFGDAENVLRQLGKTDVRQTTGNHYTRAIGAIGSVEKLMVGKPRTSLPGKSMPVRRAKRKLARKKK